MDRHSNGLPMGAAPRRLRRELAENGQAARLDRTVRELREQGLSFQAIAVVLDLYEGLELDWREVQRWVERLGVPTPPAVRGASSGRWRAAA